MKIREFVEERGRQFFFTLISVEVVFLAIITIVDIVTNQKSGDNHETWSEQRNQYYKWTVLFIFEVSEYYYAWNAILRANVLELFAFIIISTSTFIASCIRMYEISDNTVVQVFNFVFLVYEFCALVISYICYSSFYDIFFFRNIMKVGASVERQNMYRNYTYFNALNKLYVQMSLTTFTTFFFYFDTGDSWLYVADGVAILFAAVAFFFAYRGVRLENRTYMKIYVVLICLMQLYVMVKFVLTLWDLNFSMQAVSGLDIWTKLIIAVTVSVTTIIMAFDFYFAFKCQEGFGHGLREALTDSQQNSIN